MATEPSRARFFRLRAEELRDLAQASGDSGKRRQLAILAAFYDDLARADGGPFDPSP